MKEVKDLILSVGFDLDRAEERKLKASLDKQTFELEKQQREAKQLSQTLEELKRKYAALDEAHTGKRRRISELEHTYREKQAQSAAGDSTATEWLFGTEGTKTKEEMAALRGELPPLEAELDKLNAKIGETDRKLADVNAKMGVSAANVEVARQKVKEAHIPKSIKEAEKSMARFDKRVKSIVKQALVYGVIAKGLRTMVGYMGELLKSTPQYAEQLSQIKGNLMVTGASLWTAFEPAMSWLLSALNQLTQLLAVGVSSMLGQTREEAIKAAKDFDKLTKSSKRVTSSLDTLHKLGDNGILTSYEALENIDEDKWDSLAGKFEHILGIATSIGIALLGLKVGKDVLGFFSGLEKLGFKAGVTTLTLTLSAVLLWNGIKKLGDDNPDNDLEGKLETSAGVGLATGVAAKALGASAGAAAGLAAGGAALALVGADYYSSNERKQAAEEIDAMLEQIDEKYKDKPDNIWNKINKFMDQSGTVVMESLSGILEWGVELSKPGGLVRKIIKEEMDKGTVNAAAKGTLDGAVKGLTQSNEDLTDTVARATAAMETLNRYRALSTPHVPRLATGTVIPPNNPYLAVVGDQKRGTNIEAPLETIVDAMRIALHEQDSGRDITVVMQYDGREFGRAVYHANNEETQRVGVRLAKT